MNKIYIQKLLIFFKEVPWFDDLFVKFLEN